MVIALIQGNESIAGEERNLTHVGLGYPLDLFRIEGDFYASRADSDSACRSHFDYLMEVKERCVFWSRRVWCLGKNGRMLFCGDRA